MIFLNNLSLNIFAKYFKFLIVTYAVEVSFDYVNSEDELSMCSILIFL